MALSDLIHCLSEVYFTLAPPMIDIESALTAAHERLNSAYEEYKGCADELASEFHELRLQACIFQYDICVEMASIIRNEPSGFSLSVALKGIVHKLFEYYQTLNKHIIPKLLRLATARCVPDDRDEIRAERKNWQGELCKLEARSVARNNATGHYEPNMEKQVAAIRGIDQTEVMGVSIAFLSFNMAILRILAKAGRGNGA